MTNYYSILNIEEKSTAEEIKKAYRKLALEWHPDKNKSINAKEKFIEINEAYTILINKDTREDYDYLWDLYNNEKTSVVSHQVIVKEKEYSFKTSQNQAKKEAEIKAKTTFQEFYNSFEKIAEQTSNGCGVIMAFALLIAFGPYPLYYITESIFIDYHRLHASNIVLLCIFDFLALIVTVVFIIFLIKVIKRESK